jgi:hypothetical protein
VVIGNHQPSSLVTFHSHKSARGIRRHCASAIEIKTPNFIIAKMLSAIPFPHTYYFCQSFQARDLTVEGASGNRYSLYSGEKFASINIGQDARRSILPSPVSFTRYNRRRWPNWQNLPSKLAHLLVCETGLAF